MIATYTALSMEVLLESAPFLLGVNTIPFASFFSFLLVAVESFLPRGNFFFFLLCQYLLNNFNEANIAITRSTAITM